MRPVAELLGLPAWCVGSARGLLMMALPGACQAYATAQRVLHMQRGFGSIQPSLAAATFCTGDLVTGCGILVLSACLNHSV